MLAGLKSIVVFALGLLAALICTLVLTFGATGHPAPAPHGHAYKHNTFPEGYYKYYEPDGEQYLGVNAMGSQKRYYWHHKKVKVNGRYYYQITAQFRWVDARGRDNGQHKRLYAALHKYDDPGSKKPAFRVLMTKHSTGKTYWRRFEHATTVPPNSVILPPEFPIYAGEQVTWKLFSPDPTARFMSRVEPLGVQRGPYHKCGERVTYTVGAEPRIIQVRAYDAAGNVDPTPDHVKYDPL